MKLKVISPPQTPKKARTRIVLQHDDSDHEWVRDEAENTFVLYSRTKRLRSDRIFDDYDKIWVDAPSPFLSEPDADTVCDGFSHGERLRPDIIAFSVDLYDHSGRAYAIQGEGGPPFSCPFDTTKGAFILYVDRKRWETLGGNCKWEFVAGKPTEELLREAKEIARAEIREMNLCEEHSYYRYRTEIHDIHHEKTVSTYPDGREETFEHDVDDWIEDYDLDACGGFLTDKPAREVDFPLGIPVVSEEPSLIGETFEQECFTLVDRKTGEYIRNIHPNAPKGFTTDILDARILCRQFWESNLRSYERESGRELEIVDVTEKVWANYPECHA